VHVVVGAMRGWRCAGRRGGRDAGVANRRRRGCRGTSRGRRIRRSGRRGDGCRRRQTGAGAWRRAGVSMGERMQYSWGGGGEGWVDGETQGYQGRNDGRDASRVFSKTRSKKRRGETGSRGAGACEASWSHASWVPATSPSARAIVLITTRLKCSLHHAQAARVKGLIKRPPTACICPLFSRCPRYCPPSWRCDRHEHPDLPSQTMSCGR
jgi:hypothetical protein